MAIAAKFGAQDLNGNLFNYQQVVAPVTGGNVIVSANFTNRQGVADAKVRLALTDRPLVPMTVSSVQNLLPMAVSSTSSTVSVSTLQYLAISNTTASTNLLTTATVAVTATTVTTNVITCASTNTLTAGQPVTFSNNLGGLLGGTVYFVNTVPSTTTFTVSDVYGGAVFALTTATGSINVQQTTTNLTVGESIAFTGTSFGNSLFGNILARTVYYVKTVDSTTTFTVSATPSGSAVALTTATGTMFCSSSSQLSQINLNQPEHITISSTATTTNLLTTATVAVTATTVTTNLITCASTATFSVGHAVIFSGALGGLAANTVYFVTSIDSSTQFTVSLIRDDAPVILSTAAGSITVQKATSNFALNQAITFTGTTFGNIVANTVYYVKTLDSNTTFTVSPTLGGTAFPLVNASGTMIAGKIRSIPLVISNTTTSTNVITTASVAVTATTATTNLITCSSTSTFTVDQPVVFSGSLGGINAGTTYYVLTIDSATTFTVSLAQGGTVISLSSATGSLNVQHSTVNLLSNQPVVFYGTAIGNLVPGTTYYVLSAVSSTTFTVSATAGPGAVFSQSTSSGTMTCFTGPSQNVYIGSTDTSNQLITRTINVTNTTVTTNLITVENVTFLEVGMPVVFASSMGGLVSNQIFYIRTIESATGITVSRFLGGPVFVLTTASGSISMQQAISNMVLNQPITFGGPTFLSTVFGNIVAGTVYYVKTIVNTTTFTVSATPGGAAFTLTTGGGSGLVMGFTQMDTSVNIPNAVVAQNISIGATSSSGNLITTLTLAVTNTTATTNLITCESTSSLFVGMPVQFSGSIGGIVSTTVYYVLSILNGTQFTISATWGGAQVALSTATSSSVNLQQTTTMLSLNQPVVFTETAFGNIVAGTVYYIKTIDSTITFTVSATISSGIAGTAFTLTTHAGAMAVSAANTALVPQQPVVFTGATIPVISTNGTILSVNGSTALLTLNQPVKFLGQTYGGVVAGNIYYIQAILSTSTFAISTTPGGAAVTFDIQSNVMTLQLARGLTIEPYRSYYVRSTPATIMGNIVTVSLTPTGSSVPLISARGITQIASNLFTVSAGDTANLTLNQPVQFIGTRFGSVLPMSAGTIGLPYLITATNSSNQITTSSTANLIAGQPVIFMGTYTGRIVPFQTFYIRTIDSSTLFQITATPGGAAVTLTDTSSQTYFMLPSYYVKAIPSSTHVLVSPTPDGPIQTFVTGTGSMTLQGQPMYGDFLEFEAIIAGGGVLERTGIIVPPNTYLYASSNITGVNAIAIGIQENT
jgi:hypothetical protein